MAVCSFIEVEGLFDNIPHTSITRTLEARNLHASLIWSLQINAEKQASRGFSGRGNNDRYYRKMMSLRCGIIASNVVWYA